VACLVVACREDHEVLWDRPLPGPPVVAADSSAATPGAALEPGALASVRAAPVDDWTGPGNRRFEVALRTAEAEAGQSRRFGSITLPITLRQAPAGLSQYPCTSCHAGARLTMGARRVPDAHDNIRPIHPDTSGGVCATCHAPENAELLILMGRKRATMDQSYRLCAQCHFAQADAWAGGGHGKRLDGWQGRRVVLACTDCHDPHHPGVEPRVPFRAPVIERIRSQGP
jgi:hypothetical protein